MKATADVFLPISIDDMTAGGESEHTIKGIKELCDKRAKQLEEASNE